MVQNDFNKVYVGETKHDVFVKNKSPDNGQFQRWLRSQGQIF